MLVLFMFGSPVLLTHDCSGKNAKIFKLYKFRTMMDERDEIGELLPNEIRLTEFGQLLRSTSTDVLPSLINILPNQRKLLLILPNLTVTIVSVIVLLTILYNRHNEE